jgi:hypothetical protein
MTHDRFRTWEEIDCHDGKIKAFEESINTIWLPEQWAELTGQPEKKEAA